VHVGTILAGKSYCCRSCSVKLRMAKMTPEERVAIAMVGSAAAASIERRDPLKEEFGDTAVNVVLNTLSNAKQRCTNMNCNQYADYGLRGIKFMFPTVRAGAEWILRNLGPRPEGRYSLDRIDNNRHYEPGNLRWATYADQARNKRTYKRTRAGERIRAIMEQRPDLTYETVRGWIKQGMTDEEILGRQKYARSSL